MCKEQKVRHETKSSSMTVVFSSMTAVFSSMTVVFSSMTVVLLQHTRTEKCNLLDLYDKNSNGLLKNCGGIKKEKQVRCYNLTRI